MAAVLACGDDAVISRRSSALLWLLSTAPGNGDPVEVTVPHGRCRSRPGILVRMLSGDVAEVDGIPVTSVERTIVDLATTMSSIGLRRVLALAVRDHGIDPAVVLRRCAGRRGAAMLRKLMDGDTAPAVTRSVAEERFLGIVTRARLPRPMVNAWIEGYEVDFLWPAQRIIVEVDGFAFHSTRASFENDRRRDAELSAQGYRIMRVTWHQLETEHEAVLVRLTQALIRAAHPATGP